MIQDIIVILDLGGKNNVQIAREIRKIGVYSEIHPFDISVTELRTIKNLKGIILNSFPNNDKFKVNPGIFDIGVPILEMTGENEKAWPENETELSAFLTEFVYDECRAENNWCMSNFIADQLELIKQKVGDGKVLLALSGGVDSSVVAALLHKAIGDQLVCVHVNHGLLRKGEPEQVIKVFKEGLKANLVYIDAAERFLGKLAGVSDPEKKRKIIGEEFIRVFEEEADKLDGIKFLAQGTIYPDIIESGTKTSENIKSHHNVGGLPENFNFELVEPIKMLFKDEVRACGLALGLPTTMVFRQPFPGPGLGVRCPGAITKERLEAVRESDAILREEFDKNGLSETVWQYFTVVPDFKSTGMKNGKRTFDWPVIVRAINTVDAMTAEPEELEWDVIHTITDRILAEVEGVNRVMFDFTPKPPATIEFE